MGRVRRAINGLEIQPLRGGRKRNRSLCSQNLCDGAEDDESIVKQSTLTSRSVSRLRRAVPPQCTSKLHISAVAEHISREARFMEGLPLKAPCVPDEVCDGCGKTECGCEPESDSEDTQEEPVKDCGQKLASTIREKTDVVRDYSGRIVNDQGFQIFIVILILINSLFIGMSTFDFVEDNPDAYRAFRILDLSFLIIFTLELVMQFLYHGYNLFFDGWLLFDLFIVLTSWTLESISVLRTLRLRSFRIFRAFRLTTRIRALRRLVEAIFDVLPKITAIIVMFALIMYIFAVMSTELFGGIDFTYRFQEGQAGSYDYFSRLDYSLFTLFTMVTLDWAAVTRAVMEVYPWAWAIFSTFVTFSSFVLYNLIIAVVCDAVKMVQDQQDILMVENYVKDKIESRHRIINLRQKLDKMSKQQMDLLLYVQLMLEQVVGVDEASRQHYEEALLRLGKTNQNARVALQEAVERLDEFSFAGESGLPNLALRDPAPHREVLSTLGTGPTSRKFEKRRSVSFSEFGSREAATTFILDDESGSDDAEVRDYRFVNEDRPAGSEIDESFHSCLQTP